MVWLEGGGRNEVKDGKGRREKDQEGERFGNVLLA
jgi:hypothetical protein